MGVLKGKVAVITGATAGLGKAIATRYLDEGAEVVAVGRSIEKLDDLVQKYKHKVLPLKANVSRLNDNKKMLKTTLDTFGKVDIFVGNAGIFDGNIPINKIDENKLDESFDELFSINVKGMILGSKLLIPELAKTKGTIILSASHASFYSGGGGTLYTASKHAVAGLIKEMAFELAPTIRVNGVAPGIIQTAMDTPDAMNLEAPSIISGVEKSLPLPFIPEPADYAELYVLLASKHSIIMTGTIIKADNGISIRGLAKTSGDFKFSE